MRRTVTLRAALAALLLATGLGTAQASTAPSSWPFKARWFTCIDSAKPRRARPARAQGLGIHR